MRLIHRATTGRLPTSTFDLEDDGAVLGFTQIRHRPSHSSDLPPEAANHIYYEVAEPKQGRGYGKQLLALALAEAKRIGLEAVRLTCASSNPASRRIIEINGGTMVDMVRSDAGEQFLIYQIDLS